MTPLKLLGAASLFVLALAAQPALAINDAAPAAPSVDRQQAAPQTAPRPQLSPEERKAKRQHRREMRRKRQLEQQPGRQNSVPPQQP